MTWLIFALAAAVSWAVGQVLIKRGLENVPPLWNNILYNFFGLLLWVPAALLLSGFRINLPTFPIFLTIFTVASCFMVVFYAFSKGEISLVGTLTAGYPVVTVVLSYLFLGERLSAIQFFGIPLVLMGGVAIALPEWGLRKAKNLSWVKWGLLAASLVGLGNFLTKVSVNQIGSYSHIFFIALMYQFLSGANYLLDKRARPLPKFSGKTLLPTLLGNAVYVLGALFISLAFGLGKASLVTTVSSTNAALMVVLATVFLKERLTLRQACGIGGAILGVVLIGLGSA